MCSATSTVQEKETETKAIASGKVGCIPISLTLDAGGALIVQASSSVVPNVKTKASYDHGSVGDVIVNRNDLFVFYTKTCCEAGETYNSYRYFILAVAGEGEKDKYMPVSFGEIYYDYSDLFGMYKTYNFKEIRAPKDMTGILRTWDECGNSYILSVGQEDRRLGEAFSTSSMINALK